MTKPETSSVDIPLSTFIFQNFRDAEIEKCLLYIKHDAQAIELLEELLSSKLNLKITLLISVEAVSLTNDLSEKSVVDRNLSFKKR